ncbi:hypothetical protein [Streptomyces lavendofoliae]|uniref:hypothetical protein n=1 Tax=Streptomyces lavendofoliae TaxID=67314 RepID=UPI003D9036AA
MTNGRGMATSLHLVLVWAAMAAVVPALGFAATAATWAGGSGAVVPVLALGVPVAVGLLVAVGLSARNLVPLCGSAPRRLGWAVLVFALGTLGVLAGLAAYTGGVHLGGAGTRVALTGLPYAVAAAFFVPNRWVRLGAAAALAGAVGHGGFLGPAQAQQHQHKAEMARYREHQELLYSGAPPPGMEVSRAEAGPATFGVEYRAVRQDDPAYVSLVVRSPLMPRAHCPDPVEQGVTCTVDARGEMRTVRELPGGLRAVGLTRRHREVEVEVTSQTLGEPALRRLLDSLRPLTDEELEQLMREKKIDHRL